MPALAARLASFVNACVSLANHNPGTYSLSYKATIVKAIIQESDGASVEDQTTVLFESVQIQ